MTALGINFRPDVEDGRFPPWREKSLKKRAIIENGTASPWKEAMTAARTALRAYAGAVRSAGPRRDGLGIGVHKN